MPSSLEVQQILTAPGALFEMVEEEVRGAGMPVYRHRMLSLRQLAESGLARGDQTHIVYGDRRLGFRQVIEAANGVSQGLAERGVGRGDRVAVLAANCPEWVVTFWGCVDMGAVLVGLNGWWKADEIMYGLADSGARVLIADRQRFARIAGRVKELPSLEAVYLIDDGPLPAVDGTGGRRFDELVASPTEVFPDGPIDEDDPAVILYTSGTTGRPKGAISTHRSIIANVQNTFYMTVAAAMMWGRDDVSGGGPPVSLITAPLFHVTGCHAGIVLGMAAGVKLVMTVGRFDPEQVLRLIQEEGVTIFTTVPTMVARVVENPDRHRYDLSSVRTVAYGGSPSGSRLQREVRETFPNVAMIRNAYGLTESSSAVTVNSGPEMAERPESVGRPVPGISVQIVGADGAPLGPRQPGEIWLKGAQIFPGYWNKPEETATVITDGWLRTGDIGYLDEEGYLYVTDRAKDMIIRGGENVYCVEIEDRLTEHPSVMDAAVVGVPHPVLGEEVKAIVQVAPGSGLTEEELKAWVGERLANFKVPAYVEFRHERLPRNPTGKLLKNLLRGQGEGATSFAEVL